MGELVVDYNVVRTQELQRLMNTLCKNIEKEPSTIRFLYRWSPVLGTDTAAIVSFPNPQFEAESCIHLLSFAFY